MLRVRGRLNDVCFRVQWLTMEEMEEPAELRKNYCNRSKLLPAVFGVVHDWALCGTDYNEMIFTTHCMRGGHHWRK